jgi:hypothetical protein
MLTKTLHDAGPRSWHLHVASLASIALCITLWIRAKTVDQEERERRAPRALRRTVATDVLAHRRLAARARAADRFEGSLDHPKVCVTGPGGKPRAKLPPANPRIHLVGEEGT